jgi:peptide/nickel transport system ATP-binding protein/oligopeptide transport system ATP-binding protein
MSVLMITHDLGVIAEVSDDVVVVYAGKAVEYADVVTIFKNPRHPYTMALQNSIPRLTDKPGKILEVIQGGIPDPLALPSGCKFHPRCKFTIDICKEREPELEKIKDNHIVRCWMYNKDRAKDFEIKREAVGIIHD